MESFVLNATVMIGMGDVADVDITPFVISIERNLSICDIYNHFVINLAPTFKTFVDRLGFWLKPYDPITIDESGIRVFKGYLSKVRIGKKPQRSFILEGDDNYKRARDYFNEDANEQSVGENVNFWTTALTTRCGISYTLDDSYLGDRGVAPGTIFGLKNVSDCLESIAAFAGGYFYMDVNGVLHLHKGQFIDENNVIIVSGGSTFNQPAEFPIYSGGNVFNAEWYKDDAVTRNHVIVWGYKDPTITLASGESPWITSERWNDIALPVNRTVLYTTPMIQTQTEADRLADDISEAFNHYVSIKTFDINGNPNIKLGSKADYYVHLQDKGTGTTIVGNGPITSYASKLNKDGYVHTIKIDETCPKFAGWSVEPRSLKAIWILARQEDSSDGGNGVDPIQHKLVYTTDFGLGGQPTYHIIKGVPEGILSGMKVLRDGSRLFLISSTYDELTKKWSWYIHYSDNPMKQNGEWTLLLKTGDSLGTVGEFEGVTLDDTFNDSPFGSMQCFGKALYLGLRGLYSIPIYGPSESGSVIIGYNKKILHISSKYENNTWKHFAYDRLPATSGSYSDLDLSDKANKPSDSFPQMNGKVYYNGINGCNTIYGTFFHGSYKRSHAHSLSVGFDTSSYWDTFFVKQNSNTVPFNGSITLPNPRLSVPPHNYIGEIWCNEKSTSINDAVIYFLHTNKKYTQNAFPYEFISPEVAWEHLSGDPTTGTDPVNSTSLRRLSMTGYTGNVISSPSTGNINYYNMYPSFLNDNDVGFSPVKGDYFGTQVQFVDYVPNISGDTDVGDLYISPTGALGTFQKVFRWHRGIVICIDSKNPNKLAWFASHYGTSTVTSAGNEQARLSVDGGLTWESMTGNWWGEKDQVLNDEAIQVGGNICILFVEPTFVMTE